MKASRVIMVKNRLERLAHEREEDTTMIKILLVEDDLGLSNSVFDFLCPSALLIHDGFTAKVT